LIVALDNVPTKKHGLCIGSVTEYEENFNIKVIAR